MTTEQLYAGVLDFRSLEAGETITLDLAGGFDFDGDLVSFTGGDDTEIGSSVNNFDINALQGTVRLQAGNNVDVMSFGGDFNIDSQNADINLNAPNGQLLISGSEVLVDGKYETLGVEFTTTDQGDIFLDAATGQDFGNIGFEGDDVNFQSNSFRVQSSQNTVSFQSDERMFLNGETTTIGANFDIDMNADSGDMFFDAGNNFSIGSNQLVYRAANGIVMGSVLDSITFTPLSSATFSSADAVEISGVSGGVSITATSGSIASTAGQYIDIVAMDTINVSASSSMDLTSNWGEVLIGTDESTSVSITADTTELSSNANAMYQAQGSLMVSGNSTTAFSVDVDHLLQLSAGNDLVLYAPNDQMLFESSDNIFVEMTVFGGFFADNATIRGDIITIDTGNDIYMEANQTMYWDMDDVDITGYSAIDMDADTQNWNLSGDLQADSGNNFFMGGSDGNTMLFQGDIDLFVGQAVAIEGESIYAAISLSIVAGLQSSTIDSDFIFSHSTFIQANDDISMTAHTDVDFQSDYGMILISAFDAYFHSHGSLDVIADTDIYVDATSDLDVTTSALFRTDADNDMTIQSQDILITGDTMGMDANDELHVFARREFLMEAINGSLSFDLGGDFTLSSGGEVILQGDTLNLNGDDIFFEANYGNGGEISFSSTGGSLSIHGDDLEWDADYFHLVAGNSMTFTSDDLDISVDDSGEISFSSVRDMYLESSLGDISFTDTADISLSGMAGVNFWSDVDTIITSDSKQDISFNSGDDIWIYGDNDVNFDSDNIKIAFMEMASMSIESNITLSAGRSLTFAATGDADIWYDGDILVQGGAGDGISIQGGEDVWVSGADVVFNATSVLNLGAAGDGMSFWAMNDIWVTGGPTSLVSNAGDNNSWTAWNGTVQLTSVNGELGINGGESTYTTGPSWTMSLLSNNTFSSSSNNDGSTSFMSGESLLEYAWAGEWSITHLGGMYPTANGGNDPSNYGDGAGYGYIVTTMDDANICLTTYASSNDGMTTFSSGEDLIVNAWGPMAPITLSGTGSVSTTTGDVGSIGISSDGWLSDPDFVLSDPLGILLRTAREDEPVNGVIGFDSAAGIAVFGQGDVSITSENGMFTAVSDWVDFRSTDYEADITVIATDGVITQDISDDGWIIAGTQTIGADLHFNATGATHYDISELDLHQLGSNTDPDRRGITFEAYYGRIHADTNDATFYSDQDGGLNFIAENGDMQMNTTQGLRIEADTGIITMEGREGVFLTAQQDIDIFPSGDGGYALFSTSGGNTLRVGATVGGISFSADAGEIDIQGTTSVQGTAQGGITVTAQHSCINAIGGGSVQLSTFSNMTFDTDISMLFDADAELTVDATETFTVTGGNTLIRMNTGGSGTNNGVSVQSQGDIYVYSELEHRYNSLNAFVQADNVLTMQSDEDSVMFESTPNSGSQDNILIQSNNGDVNVTSTAGWVQEWAEIEHEITSSSLISFLSVNQTRFQAEREMVMDISGDASFLSNEGNINILAKSAAFTANQDVFITADDSIAFIADHALKVTADDMTFLTTNLNESITFRGGVDTRMELTAEGGDFLINADESFFASIGNLLDVDGNNDITFTGVNDIDFATLYGDMTLSSIDDMTFTTSTGNINVDSLSGDMGWYTQASIDITAGTDMTLYGGSFFSSSFSDTSFTGQNLNMTIGDVNEFTARNGDITFDTGDFSVTSNDDLYFTSFGALDDPIGFTIDANTIDIDTVQDLLIHSVKGAVTFDSQFNLNITSQNSMIQLFSFQDGILFESNSNQRVIVDNNIFMQTVGTHYWDVDTLIDIDTPSNFVLYGRGEQSHIRLKAQSTSFIGDSIVMNSRLDSPTVGLDQPQGIIRHAATQIIASGQNFTTEAEGSVIYDAHGPLSLSTGVVDFITQNEAIYQADGNQLITNSGGDLNLRTYGEYSDISIQTDSLFLSSSDVLDLVGFDEARVDSSSYVRINALTSGASTVSFTAPANSIDFLAEVEDIFIVAQTYQASSISGNIEIHASQSQTQEAIFDVDSFTLTGNQIWLDSGRNIYAAAHSFVPTDSFFATSAADVVLEGNIVSLTATNNINIITSMDGTIEWWANDVIQVSSTGDLNIELMGNLGSLGGRYVFEENMRDFGSFQQQETINLNYNAFESVAVHGSNRVLATDNIEMIAKAGMIEFRAQWEIHYHASGSSGRIGFFGILEDAFGITLQNGGQQMQTTLTERSNYCATVGGSPAGCSSGVIFVSCTVECTELSQATNDIIRALVAYNLARCDGSNFCCAAGVC